MADAVSNTAFPTTSTLIDVNNVLLDFILSKVDASKTILYAQDILWEKTHKYVQLALMKTMSWLNLELANPEYQVASINMENVSPAHTLLRSMKENVLLMVAKFMDMMAA